jgi:tRNA 2-thiouridine synthesizing protein D
MCSLTRWYTKTQKRSGIEETIMKKLTLALMDPPYESANSTTALRIISAALEKGIDVNVFAYEGAVCLPLKDQAPHANPVKGTTVEDEAHPTTRAFISSLLEIGKDKPLLTWVNCGLCVDERGATNVVEGVKRGSPADFFKMASESTNTLVIPTK